MGFILSWEKTNINRNSDINTFERLKFHSSLSTMKNDVLKWNKSFNWIFNVASLMNLPTKGQTKRTQNAQSHHVAAMENAKRHTLCVWMQKGCPDSWWYIIYRHMESYGKERWNFNAPRTHLKIIRSSRLGIFFTKHEERRNQIFYIVPIDWLKRLRQNTIFAGEAVYITTNFLF